MGSEKKWYAIYTKPRWEKKVARLLSEKGIEYYCPLSKTVRQWSDRKKVILEPVFKSYVFVRVEEEHKWELRKIDGILNFVFWLGKPAIIRDEEIITIQKFLNEFSEVEVTHRDALSVNSPVIVKTGVMMNFRGMIVEVIGNRARVKLSSLGLELTALFDKSNLEPVSPLGTVI
jgi:transcription antitermination factor NusG